jgi:hypothetical protein
VTNPYDTPESWPQWISERINDGALQFHVGSRRQSKTPGYVMVENSTVKVADYSWCKTNEAIGLEIAKSLRSLCVEHALCTAPHGFDYGITALCGDPLVAMGAPNGKDGRLDMFSSRPSDTEVVGDGLRGLITLLQKELEIKTKQVTELSDSHVKLADAIFHLLEQVTTTQGRISEGWAAHHDGRAAIADAEARMAEANANARISDGRVTGLVAALDNLVKSPAVADALAVMTAKWASSGAQASSAETALAWALARLFARRGADADELAAACPSFDDLRDAVAAGREDEVAAALEQVTDEWKSARVQQPSVVAMSAAADLDRACGL